MEQSVYLALYPTCPDSSVLAILEGTPTDDLLFSPYTQLCDAHKILMGAGEAAIASVEETKPEDSQEEIWRKSALEKEMRGKAQTFMALADHAAHAVKYQEGVFRRHFDVTGDSIAVLPASGDQRAGLINFAQRFLDWHGREWAHSAKYLARMSTFGRDEMRKHVVALERA